MTSPNVEDDNTHDESEPGRSPTDEMMEYINKVTSETYLDEAHGCIVIAESVGYWIPVSSIRTELDAFRWLDHLARKTWFTRHHVHRFITICCRLLDCPLYDSDDPKPARQPQRRKRR